MNDALSRLLPRKIMTMGLEDSPAEWINEAIFQTGKTGTGLAQALGIAPSAVSHMRRGRKKVRPEDVPVIEAYFGIPAAQDIGPEKKSPSRGTTFGGRIRLARETRRLNLSDVADALGVSIQAVSMWEGLTEGVRFKHLSALSTFLHVDPMWLSTGSGVPSGDIAAQHSAWTLRLPEGDVTLKVPHRISPESLSLLRQWIKINLGAVAPTDDESAS